MANESRRNLQTKLEELLGTRNVYYQPPASKKMSYTAIRYSIKKMDKRYANNAVYSKLLCYEIIVIAQSPEDPVIEKIMALPYCTFDRHYDMDNLSHDVFTLYY